ncbi:MAG: T9SS type A sorting domain-containing protein [Bacteroidales bacterium]|nr:T9SS type A sorting domain-containing protein [Bacteroidales bacterium]
MKKAIVFFGFLFLVLSLKAQVELVHSFDESVGYVYFEDELGFYSYNYSDDELIIFNPDYTQYKSIVLGVPLGYEVYAILHMSDKLFNLDEYIEYVLVIWDGIDDYSMKLYNENQEMLFDFGGQYYSWIISSNDNTCLHVREMNYDENLQIYLYNDQIYSVPGSLPMDVNESNNMDLGKPYPNPSSKVINIPISNETGSSTNLKIYNINGQLIEQKQIAPEFDCFRLNVDSYQRGVYLYKYNGISNKFIVE